MAGFPRRIFPWDFPMGFSPGFFPWDFPLGFFLEDFLLGFSAGLCHDLRHGFSMDHDVRRTKKNTRRKLLSCKQLSAKVPIGQNDENRKRGKPLLLPFPAESSHFQCESHARRPRPWTGRGPRANRALSAKSRVSILDHPYSGSQRFMTMTD